MSISIFISLFSIVILVNLTNCFESGFRITITKIASVRGKIVIERKIDLIMLRKEQWDSDGYLEGTAWDLNPRAAELPRSPFM